MPCHKKLKWYFPLPHEKHSLRLHEITKEIMNKTEQSF